MSANSLIEWTDHTFNPWEGCQKVGPGCDHCYAETRNARFGGGTAVNWGPGAPRRRTSVKNWGLPKQWSRDAAAFLAEHGRRQRVFCSSLADVFDNAVEPQWRVDLWNLIDETPNLDWLLLTKRIGNARAMLPIRWMFPDAWPAHVRIGATIVNQPEADRDIARLLELPVPNFLSMEPLLGPVDLTRCSYRTTGMEGDGNRWTLNLDALSGFRATSIQSGVTEKKIDWVIVGGESGPGARPMRLDWARSLRDQCAEAGVPFMFKQWGEWCPVNAPDVRLAGNIEIDLATDMAKVGKKAAGRLLDGRTHDGVPA